MSVHKLTAGSGYDYLTRQVAALDASEKGHTGLASYYTERGEAPGQWVGSGLAGIDGLTTGDPVTAQQMQALFGSGHHPLAAERLAALETRHLALSEEGVGRGGPRAADRLAVTRLGRPFPVYSGDVSPFRVEVARRIAALNTDAGLPADSPVPADERARVRSEVAREFFAAEHGRVPHDARELAAEIARQSRPKTTAVAGYDLTFSPVKSVSALWAIAPPEVAARIELAHQGAVADALRFIETHALYTRTGTHGVRQVDVTGLVGTAFTHRDSRAGDPDLHTHVAIANKVQTLPTTNGTDSPVGGGGRWLSIDGRVLFKAVVTASETYNTALETRLRDDLGLRFAAREVNSRTEDRKRPVREIVGLPAVLLRAWSVRRADIEVRRGELAARFQRDHGRPPTPVETLHLAQQANLETRAAKHEPRTLAEQRATWRAQAEHVLGGPQPVRQMLHDVLANDHRTLRQQQPTGVDGAWLDVAAARAVAALQARRSTWQVWHVRAEAQRQVRSTAGTRLDSEQAVDALVDEVLRRHSVTLTAVERDTHGQEVHEPTQLRRDDGSSVYRVAGADLFTSASVLAAEQRLVAVAGRRDGRTIDAAAIEIALLKATANGTDLNAGQVALVRQMATSGARLQLAIAPAGAGKTTAMSALATAWTHGGGTVVGLAPSAAAAAALREHIGASSSGGTGSDSRRDENADTEGRVQTETLAKLTWSIAHGELPSWAAQIDATTLVVIDEAGMADTLSLDAAVEFVVTRGGSVRLVGDDQQLAAIGAGGVLRDIQASHGAVHLSELLRFRDPAEGAVTLTLREGRSEALGFYLDHNRVHVGDLTTLTDAVFDAWLADRAAGLDSIMLAPTHDLVSNLNQRARAHRLTTIAPATPSTTATATAHSSVAMKGEVVLLADGNKASAGDLLITRTNDRSLRSSPTDWVKNGDRWTLTRVHNGGSVTARHVRTGRAVVLPAAYVQTSTELGYATTVHSAQGVSVDTMHGLVGGSAQGQGPGGLSRQQLYTMLTRGRLTNHVYLEVVGDGDPHSVIRPDLIHPLTATDHLEAILARDDAPVSATTSQREQSDPAARLGDAAARYVDALHLAAEDHLGRDAVAALEITAEHIVSGVAGPQAAPLLESPAWPALRAHLMLLAAAGTNPVNALEKAAAAGGLADARDVAAVLDWRLDDTGLRSAGRGPLPWLPAVPAALRDDPTWGEYLTIRADLVHDLAQHIRHQTHTNDTRTNETRTEATGSGRVDPAADTGAVGNVPPSRGERSRPAWLDAGRQRPPVAVVADVQVWRAAMQVAPADRRPTGGPQLQKAAHAWQRTLNQRVQGDRSPAQSEWGHLLHRLSPALRHDPFTPVLADRLAALSRAGVDARTQLTRAANERALPDDHAAAALWWRISRHVSPAVATNHITRDGEASPLPTAWTHHLPQVLGEDRAQAVMTSPWWPALVTVIDHGLRRGWQPHTLLAAATPPPPPPPTGTNTTPRDETAEPSGVGWTADGGTADGGLADGRVADGGDGDVCLAMVWRASVLTDPVPHPAGSDIDHDYDHFVLEDPPPPDLWDGVVPDDRHLVHNESGRTHGPDAVAHQAHHPYLDARDARDARDAVQAELSVHARLRRVLGPPEPSPVETERLLLRARDIETSPVSPERVTDINQTALAFFQQAYRGSWAQAYLHQRFAQDLTGHPTIQPGYAPAGWAGLVRHLRAAGVTDQEMIAAGVATTASTGRLIDRFRDRAVLPLLHDGRVLAFVARRHPDLTGSAGPDNQHGNQGDHQHSHRHGPKYLNTATTVAYSKSAQLYVADPALFERGATPVLVEGPMDAIAVTLAMAGTHVGVAPLGTALSEQQAAQLARHHTRTFKGISDGTNRGTNVEPVVATDGDLAGRTAAERAYWTLTLHGMDPTLATVPPGIDPAALLTTHGPRALRQALLTARPLGGVLLDDRLADLPSGPALDPAVERAVARAVAVVAARPPEQWVAAANTLSQRTRLPRYEVDHQLLGQVKARHADPRRVTADALDDLGTVRRPVPGATGSGSRRRPRPAAERWTPLACSIDPRLVAQADWPMLADLLDRLDGPHLDVAVAARVLASSAPLGEDAARELRYRLINTLGHAMTDATQNAPPTASKPANSAPASAVPATSTPASTMPGASAQREALAAARTPRSVSVPPR